MPVGAAPSDLNKEVHKALTGTRILTPCKSAGWVMVDLHVVVGPRITVSEAHEIGNEVSRRLRHEFPLLTDVIFHVDPEDDAGEGDPSYPGMRDEVVADHAAAARDHVHNAGGKNLGAQLAEAKRSMTQDETTKHIPIILCTTKNQETDKIWAMRQGAKGYVTKPVDGAELLKKITALG